MGKLRNRYIIFIAILFLASIIVNYLTYDTFYEAEAALRNIEKIPLKIGKWQGTDIPLQQIVYDILETKAIIQ